MKAKPFVAITIRVPTTIIKQVDAARGLASRSAWVKWKFCEAVQGKLHAVLDGPDAVRATKRRKR